jgi:O-antigen/teichoic acid export membrane protein
VTHQLATGRTATFVKLAFAAGAKTAAAFAAFALTALVTRNTPNDEAGLFLLGFTLLTVLSIFFRLGLDNVILRFLSAHGTDAFAQEKLNRGLLWIATAVIPATLLAMTFSEQIATTIFNKPEFEPVLFWMLPALPAMAIFMLLSFAFQAQHRVILTTIFQNLGISTLFIAGFGYLWFEQPDAISAVSAAHIYAVAATAIFIVAITLWFSQKNVSFSLKGYRDPELTHASMNLWTASIMSVAVQWSGILIAGVMLPAEDVALLTAAQRTAMLTSFVLMVVNMVVAPRYARLWKEGNIERIQYLAKWSTRGMIAMVLPIVTVMMVCPEKVMGLFGEGFEDAVILLMILAVGQFVNVATGSVGYLLNMSGHEKDFNRVALMTGPLTVVLAYSLIVKYGVSGAALATCIGTSVQNLAATILVKRRIGFFPLG